MKILSLFDGISCGRVALERAGLPVSRYVAYEIDGHAINVSKWNYPDIEHKESVTGGFMEYNGFDIVMGGFPCQDLSVAGKRKGLKGLPAGYTEMIPKTCRYKALGNGWNVDTIAHIFNYINVDMLI